ncbi:hypothetical protein Tco_1164115 [Tanacetum coccineum]
MENERFIPIGSAEDDKLIEKMNKKAAGMDNEVAKELESIKVEGPKENIKKRSGRRLKMKAPKRRVEASEWIFYENYGDHGYLRLEMDLRSNMAAERRYPLTKHTLKRMMDLRLTAVSDDDTVFDLLRFIVQQIDEFGGQDGSKRNL